MCRKPVHSGVFQVVPGRVFKNVNPLLRGFDGGVPACSDILASLAMTGAKTSAQSVSKGHGMASTTHVHLQK